MPIFDLSTTNSVLNNFVSELRDIEIQNDPLRFRKNLQRIGEIMAYEISKSLSYKIKSTKTPLGISKSQLLDDRIPL